MGIWGIAICASDLLRKTKGIDMFGFNGRLWLLGFWGLNAKVGGLGLVVWAFF